MIKTFELQKKLYNLCDPAKPLAHDDPANVDIDREFDGARGHRPWTAKIQKRLTLTTTPTYTYVTGAPGCGKSTDFLRLKNQLESNKDSRFFVAYVDVLGWLDLSAAMTEAELVSVILYQTEAQIIEAEGKDTDPPSVPVMQSIWHFLTNTKIELQPLKVDVKLKLPLLEFGVGSALSLERDPHILAQVRESAKKRPAEFFRKINDAIDILNTRVKKLGHSAGLVIIVDSLEKMRGTSQTHAEVISSTERLFSSSSPLTELPVHIVYAIPISQITRLPVTGVEVIPMVQVRGRDGKPCPAGVNAMKELVRRRLGESGLNELFGPGSKEAFLDTIVTATGGYLRDLLRVMQELIADDNIITEKVIQSVLTSVQNPYNLGLPASSYEWLAHVALDHELVLQEETPATRAYQDMAIVSLAVLFYRNDSNWFDLNPAVRQIDSIKRAIESLQNSRIQQQK